MSKFKAADLFAGIGGTRLGFDRAFGDEIETVYVCELDPYARKTYFTNFDNNVVADSDITKVDEKEVPEFDICLAGFPCQAFSLAGRRDGFEDNYRGICRGTLFMDVVRICERVKPKVIFCENVKGLVIHDKGKTFEVIRTAFASIGYRVHYKVLNSKDYGLAQNRELIYIVCFRNDINDTGFEFPAPTFDKVSIAGIMQAAPIPAKYYLSEGLLQTLRDHKDRFAKKGGGFGCEIRDTSDIANALICGGMGRERNLIVDSRPHSKIPTTNIKGRINDEDIRRLTPRECARLQGFPDEFKLPVADTHLYKQFGNTVPVNIIELIAKEIKIVLEREHLIQLISSVGRLYLGDENLNRSSGDFFEIQEVLEPKNPNIDVKLKLRDPLSNFTFPLGFMIRSEVDSAPTLLNASHATNFRYVVSDESDNELQFVSIVNETFSGNLLFVDSLMEQILSELLPIFYREGIADCTSLATAIEERNPLHYKRTGVYRHKLKKFLCAVALGLNPSKQWSGIDEANGGYIIVTESGDVLAYHLYNRDSFETYLLNHTKLETPSTGKHDFASIYVGDDGRKYINLNLQIRFK